MKQHLGKLILAVFISAGYCLTAHADPYAPKPDVPAGIKGEKYWVYKLKEITVPELAEVGIPPYPGTYMVGMEKIGQKTINGDVRTHPVIYLITDDERSKVSKFYKTQLANWKYEAKKKEEYFWTGEEYFSPMRAPNQNHPSLILSDLRKDSIFPSQELNLMPSAKTYIRLTYSPPK